MHSIILRSLMRSAKIREGNTNIIIWAKLNAKRTSILNCFYYYYSEKEFFVH